MRLYGNAGSPWTQRLPDNAPIYPDSAAIVADLVQQLSEPNLIYPTTSSNINRNSYTTPVYYVTNATPRVPVQMLNGDGSTISAVRNGTQWQHLQWVINQLGGVRFPSGATACPGTDGHIAVVNTETGEHFSFWRAAPPSSTPEWIAQLTYTAPTLTGGVWTVTGGDYIPDHRSHPGIFDDKYDAGGNRVEYASWGSTAMSAPITAGLILTGELVDGVIPHALELGICSTTVPEYWWPAHRYESLRYRDSIVRIGTRFRLAHNFNVDTILPGNGHKQDSASARTLRMLMVAARDYGIIINDHSDGFAFRAELGSASVYDYGDGALSALLSTFPYASLQTIHPNWRPSYYEHPPINERFG